MATDKYKQAEIEDFRDVRPYYDMVFEILQSLSRYSFEKDVIKMTRAMRELIINTAPYIKDEDPSKKLQDMDEKLKEFIEDYKNMNELTVAKQKEVEEKVEQYFDDILQKRIDINDNLHKAGFFPKTYVDDPTPAVVKNGRK